MQVPPVQKLPWHEFIEMLRTFQRHFQKSGMYFNHLIYLNKLRQLNWIKFFKPISTLFLWFVGIVYHWHCICHHGHSHPPWYGPLPGQRPSAKLLDSHAGLSFHLLFLSFVFPAHGLLGPRILVILISSIPVILSLRSLCSINPEWKKQSNLFE